MSVMTPPALLSFPQFDTPRPRAEGGEPVYSCSLVFDEEAQKTDAYKEMKKVVYETAKAKFGDKTDDLIKNGKLRMPFRDAGEKDYTGYDEGGVYISPWSKTAPGVVDGRLQDVVPSDIFPGMIVRATVNPFAYDTSGNRGVSFGLNNVQVINAKGPRLDGRKAASAEFDALDADESSSDGDGDEEIPF